MEKVIVSKRCGCDDKCGDQCRCRIKEKKEIKKFYNKTIRTVG